MLISYFTYKALYGRKHPIPGDEMPKKQPKPKKQNRVFRNAAEYLMGPHRDEFIAFCNQFERLDKMVPLEMLRITSADGLKLVGYLYHPENGSNRTAVLVHGYGSSAMQGFGAVAAEYIKRGYNLFLPDNRACGNSEGECTTFGMKESEDTALWIRELANRYPDDIITLHGISLGGSVVCLLSEMQLPSNVRAVISDCAFAKITDVLTHVMKLYHIPKSIGKGAGKWFYKYNGFMPDDRTPLDAVQNAVLPILFLQGAEDRYVLPENGVKLHEACRTEKGLVMIEGRGHAAACMGGEDYFGPLFAFLDKFSK